MDDEVMEKEVCSIRDNECPECGCKLIYAEGCKYCPICGYSCCK